MVMDLSNPFDRLDRIVSDAVNRGFSVVARIQKMAPARSGLANPTPDPDIAPWDIRGIHSSGPSKTALQGKARGSDFGGATEVQGQVSTLWIKAIDIHDAPFAIAVGDRVSFPFAATPNAYRVARVQPTDLGDLELVLTETKL